MINYILANNGVARSIVIVARSIVICRRPLVFSTTIMAKRMIL